MAQILGASLDAHVFASDNSALARDCRRDIKAANTKLLKLGRKVPHRPTSSSGLGTQAVPQGISRPIKHAGS